MRRREFIGLVGAAAGWSFGAQAQQRPMPVVGFLRSTSREDSTRLITAFQQGIHELVPKAAIIAILNHSAHSGADFVLQDAQNAARALGAQLEIVNVGEEDRDLEAAFTSLAQKNIKALVVPGGAFLLSHRNQVVALAARNAIPAIYADREYVAAGGLLSYGPIQTEAYRGAGIM